MGSRIYGELMNGQGKRLNRMWRKHDLRAAQHCSSRPIWLDLSLYRLP